MTDIVERLRFKADMIQLGEKIQWGSDSEVMREAADALEACQAEWNKERQIAEAQEITMRGLYQDIESLRETKDTFFRNAEAWEARAVKDIAEIERLQADLVIIKQAFLEERAKRGKDAAEIERLRAVTSKCADAQVDGTPTHVTRNDALEEAAQVVEGFDVHYSDPNTWATSFGRIADAIRALKKKHD